MPNQRVWVVAEQDEELYVEGDLLLLYEPSCKRATLYRTVETYIEPSQGIIDKWHNAQRPYHVDPKTHMFRMLEEVDCRKITGADTMRQMFDSVQELEPWTG